MKGIVFTEFLEHVAASFGDDMVDQIIEDSDLPSGGIYTAVGTYSHSEIVSLGATLCRHTGQSMADVVHGFGVYLGQSFVKKFTPFFEQRSDFFDFVGSVETHIHVEVRKLYPDATLPNILLLEHDGVTGQVFYRSPRGMDDLAVGLMEASAAYYGDTLTVSRKTGTDDTGSFTVFTVTRNAKADENAPNGGFEQQRSAA